MLRVFIVDDEPPARNRLKKLLRPYMAAGRLAVVGEAEDGRDALQQLKKIPCDLLFLDIQMPELDGFAVTERLAPDNPPIVVFTTAYDAYALKAFDAHAVDYLLKPIPKDRLAATLEKVERMAGTRAETNHAQEERLTQLLDWMENQQAPPLLSKEPTHYLRQISIPYPDKIALVPVEDLLMAEVQDGVTWVSLQSAGASAPKRHLVNYTLDQLETHLDPQDFMRIHRSTLIRLDQIREMLPWFSGRYKLLLHSGQEVMASRERIKTLKKRLLL